MTGTEVAQAAKQNVHAYKYIYGAKGELCTSEHIEALIAQSPGYFSDTAKAAAARLKAGSYCADCSGYVCICAGIFQRGSYALYDLASVKTVLSTVNGKVMAGESFIPLGAVVWKPGHVGIYVGNQTVVEARSELVDVQVNDIRNRDFTYCLLLPGIQYTAYADDRTAGESVSGGSGYTVWSGKIVNAPVVIPQVSPSNKAAAYGFTMLPNGSPVTVVGVSGDYYRIQSQSGYYGYVHSYYVGTAGAASYENQYCQWTGCANSTTGTVNIRKGPSVSYPQSDTLPSVANGAVMDVLGEVLGNDDNRLWYYVRVMGCHEGYVRGDLISRQVMVSYEAWIGEANSTTGTVNIRTSPTVNSSLSSVHATLNNGDTVTVTNETRGSDGYIWYAVSVAGKHAGYCRSDLIVPHCEGYYVEWDGVIATPTGSANIRTAASTAAGKVTGSPYADGTVVHVSGEVSGADGYTWYQLSVNNTYVGYCRCDLIATTSDYPQWWAKANTTTGIMNIREGAGTGYSQIAGCPSVENGTRVKVVDQLCGTDGFVWYKIIVNGSYQGYVKGTLVLPVNTPAYPVWIGCARSTTGVVNVRSQATTSSEVISGYPQLANGDTFEVIGQAAGSDGYLWFQIRIMGTHLGYLRSDLVSHGVIVENTVGYASWVGVANSTTGTVNVRQGASTGTGIVVSLANGDGVEVIGTVNGTDGYVWYQVKCNGGNGYIRSDLVMHQGDITEGEAGGGTGSVVVQMPCPPRGVTVAAGELFPEPTAAGEGTASFEMGTYLNLSFKVRRDGGEAWYWCSFGENSGYVKEALIRVFPNAEYCGGEAYETLDHHNLVQREYGVFECSECGHHVDEDTYYRGIVFKNISNILSAFHLPKETQDQLNIALTIVTPEITIVFANNVEISVSWSLNYETNGEAEYEFTIEDGVLKGNTKLNWDEYYLKLGEYEIADLNLAEYAPRVEELAMTIGIGNLETSYEVKSDSITVTYTISSEVADGVSFTMDVSFTWKYNDNMDFETLEFYQEMETVRENVNWIALAVGIVSIVVGILTKNPTSLKGLKGITKILPNLVL